MTIEQLIEKIEEIMLLAQETEGKGEKDEDRIREIHQICRDIEIDWRIEKRLKNDANTVSE